MSAATGFVEKSESYGAYMTEVKELTSLEHRLIRRRRPSYLLAPVLMCLPVFGGLAHISTIVPFDIWEAKTNKEVCMYIYICVCAMEFFLDSLVLPL